MTPPKRQAALKQWRTDNAARLEQLKQDAKALAQVSHGTAPSALRSLAFNLILRRFLKIAPVNGDKSFFKATP